jgi:hypothetical protein
MPPGNQGLAFCAPQRHGFGWLLHHASFETGTIRGVSDRLGLTLADDLVKPSECTIRVPDDGGRRSPTDADVALGAGQAGDPVKEREGETTRAPDQPEAST